MSSCALFTEITEIDTWNIPCVPKSTQFSAIRWTRTGLLFRKAIKIQSFSRPFTENRANFAFFHRLIC